MRTVAPVGCGLLLYNSYSICGRQLLAGKFITFCLGLRHVLKSAQYVPSGAQGRRMKTENPPPQTTGRRTAVVRPILGILALTIALIWYLRGPLLVSLYSPVASTTQANSTDSPKAPAAATATTPSAVATVPALAPAPAAKKPGTKKSAPVHKDISPGDMRRIRTAVTDWARRHGETEQQFYERIGSSESEVAAFVFTAEEFGAPVEDSIQSLDNLSRVTHD